MQKCPNCGQTAARTEDWACQWCGYPLLSESYEKIPKTYRQLKEERLRGQKPTVREETGVSPLPDHDIPLPTHTLEPEPKPTVEAGTETRVEPQLTSEPEIEPVPQPETEVTPEPEAELTLEAEPEPMAEPEIRPTLETQPEAVSTVVEVTAEALYSAYRDKVMADAKFTNKILKITGIVDKIVVRDVHDVYYIILTSADKKEEWNVRCTFGRKHGPELNRLKARQTVTVQGKYDGYRTNILMRDCVLFP